MNGRRGRGGNRGGFGGGARPIKGIFVNGAWHCNCQPLLPAEHFKVRKESKNQGRWFYTCQKPEGRRCGFFLWEEDAKPREEAAVLNNSRSEPGAASKNTDEPAGWMPPSPTPARHTGSQRLEAIGHDSETEMGDEESFPWSLTGAEEEDLIKQTDAVSPPPTTPKKPITFTGLATPVTGKRKADGMEEWEASGLPIPEDPRKFKRDLSPGPPITPTPSRFRDALASPDANIDLGLEVMNVLNLRNAKLDDETRGELRDVLGRATLRMQGIIKGRDVTRLQLKAKDAKIVEQQLRIATLEAELEAERALVGHLRWERQHQGDGDA